jgi:hypothetical protein
MAGQGSFRLPSGWFLVFVLLAWAVPTDIRAVEVHLPPKGPKEKKEKANEEKSGASEANTEVRDKDTTYVTAHLAEFLHPDRLEFLDDGRVRLVYGFRDKDPKHEKDFEPEMGEGIKATFRWTFWEEEHVQGGDTGLRVSDRGYAHVNCWFEGDVEVEVDYLQYMNHQNQHIFALTYTNKKGYAIGSNYGSQCVTFKKGGKLSGAQGEVIPVCFASTATIKLVVRDGYFEAHRDGTLEERARYPEKKFSSGLVGFVWGGSIAGIIPTLEITGRLDMKKMAKLIRKNRRR